MARPTAVLAALLLALAVALPASAAAPVDGKVTKIPSVKGIETLKAGSPAPDFTVKDLADQPYQLKASQGKDAVLLFFWSFFCGPCREEIPMLNEMTKNYKDKGLQVVSVNLDGREMSKAVNKYVTNEKLAFRVVFDELVGDAFAIADPYGVAGTPTLYLIDKAGTVRFSHVGVITGEKLKKEIDAVLQ
jgi:peroxiredoxin